MLLAVVAGAFAVGVVASAIRATFAQRYGLVIWAAVWFCFYYWIAVGAYRRAIRSPEDRRPPT
jgi:hypothetical protein